MRSWFREHRRPILQALLLFVILFTIVLYVTFSIDVAQVDLKSLLFVIATLCCFLIAKNVFDNAREEQKVNALTTALKEGATVASQELYLELYRNSPVPYCIIDVNGVVKSVNTAAVRMLGLPQQRIEGSNIFTKLISEPENHVGLIQQKFQSGMPVSDETVRVLRPDKKEMWVLMSLHKVSQARAQHLGLLTLVDITKQKKIEDAKTQFVSLASHQLRTPIAGIKWSAELLLMDKESHLSDRQKKYIDRLLVSVQRMALLVDDFLRVSRFELGTFQPEYDSVDLRQLFDDIVLEQAARAEQKEITVKTFYDDSLTAMVSDPNLVRMIVSNIYGNAMKYTREGGTVHIGYSGKEDTIVISIVDNGMGIPASEQDRIFSKLFRASNAVRDVPDGTGLGLYIVHEAIHVLRGSISFKSAENMGTTFEVVLPLERPKVEKKAEPTPPDVN